MSARRKGRVARRTNETDVDVFLDLDCYPGSGVAQDIDIHTGIGFLDHVCALLELQPANQLGTPFSRCTMLWRSMEGCPCK